MDFSNNREQIVARTDYIETVNHAESIFLTYSMLKNSKIAINPCCNVSLVEPS